MGAGFTEVPPVGTLFPLSGGDFLTSPAPHSSRLVDHRKGWIDKAAHLVTEGLIEGGTVGKVEFGI